MENYEGLSVNRSIKTVRAHKGHRKQCKGQVEELQHLGTFRCSWPIASQSKCSARSQDAAELCSTYFPSEATSASLAAISAKSTKHKLADDAGS